MYHQCYSFTESPLEYRDGFLSHRDLITMVLPDQILHMLQQVTGRLGVGEWPIKALGICQDDS